MRGLTFHGKGDIRFESVPDPVIETPTDAIVRLRLGAICGSDLHVYHERERGLDRGTVMGHEFVGEVVEVGPGVEHIARGSRVLSPFTTSCGQCFYCRRGLTARCAHGALYGWVQDGSGLEGAQAEYIRVPLADGTLVEIPETVPDEEALLLGDVLSTGYFCARQAEVNSEGVYAVVGCGPVGLMACVGAHELGARTVYAIDSVPERLALAARFGAIPINFETSDPVGTLRDATDGRGADAVLEVVGSPAASRLAMDLLRPGGTLSIVGVHTEEHFSISPVEAYDKNLTLRIGRCPARAVLAELLPMVEQRKYDLGAVFSHRLPLSEGARGYEIFDRKQDGCTKVLLTP
jgi:threonine dehydrogenase-like Zn-dependent dehydrogenase